MELKLFLGSPAVIYGPIVYFGSIANIYKQTNTHTNGHTDEETHRCLEPECKE